MVVATVATGLGSTDEHQVTLCPHFASRAVSWANKKRKVVLTPVSGNHGPFLWIVYHRWLGAPIGNPQEHHGWYCDDGVGCHLLRHCGDYRVVVQVP